MKHSAICLLLAGGSLWAQAPPAGSLTCDATGDPVLVRQEGVTESLGTIVLQCAALSQGPVSGGIIVFVSVPVTNRANRDDRVDARITVDTDTGAAAIGGSPVLVGGNTLVFGNFTFTPPRNGLTTFRITNIRANGTTGTRPITATISTNGQSGIGIRTNPVTIGVPQRSLLAAATSARIVCRGSNLPEEPAFQSLLGSASFTFRVTEALPAGFQARQPGALNGQRILVKYFGFPKDARLFVPNVVAGSTAQTPTSVGEFGVSISGGVYTARTGGLVLTHVPGADLDGAGSNALGIPDNAGASFNGVTEIRLVDGNGSAAFEVLEANPFASEYALIPTFVTLPANSASIGTVATASVSFGPLSRQAAADTGSPVPRYSDIGAPNDCAALRDCNASYFPKLLVRAPQLTFTWEQSTRTFASHYITVNNEGGGIMNWVASVTYRSGQGWLRADPPSGVNSASIILSLVPDGLAPGSYEATFKVEAGNAGSITYLVTLLVTPGGAGPGPQPGGNPNAPRLSTIGNAANLAVATLVPGSLASVEGANLRGDNVSVTVGGFPAKVVNATAGRLTFLVPEELAGQTIADLRVEVDRVAAAIVPVKLGPAAPVLFEGGVLNGNGTRNSGTSPQQVGGYMQMFATGLPLEGVGTILARLHDRDITLLAYGGPAPGQEGVQQVNIWVPDELPAMLTEVTVCGQVEHERFCAPPAPVWLGK